MSKMNDDSPMPFGKHKGKRIEDVPANYLLWLGGRLQPDDAIRTALLLYITENQSRLEMEVLEHQPRDDEID